MSQSNEEKKGFFARIWGLVDGTRRLVFNLVFIVLMVGLMVALVKDNTPEVPEKAALVLRPSGNLVEQLAGDPLDRAIDEITGQGTSETLAEDLRDAIAAATTDDRIQAILLDVDGLGGAGLTTMQSVAREMKAFRAAGKTIVAAADSYDRNGYFLAAHADEVLMDQGGFFMIEGYSRFKTYYKEGLDKFGIQFHVFRVGTFKSAVEPYLRSDMSEAAKEANLEYMGDLWQTWLADVSAERGMSPEQLHDFINAFGEGVQSSGGKLAQLAIDGGLIDRVATREEVRSRMIELVGEDEEKHTYHAVGLSNYLENIGDERPGHDDGEGDAIGLIIAKGTILDGDQSPGKIGGDSTARLLRKARNDDNIKAVVLQVDSGGGSKFASEIIRRECELLREAGKPVVISMGNVAASGGYWISMSSDEVWANPATITGSIGIFGAFPTFQEPMREYLGWRVDGVGTTEMAGRFRPDIELKPEIGEAIQTIIEEGYDEFITKVAAARGMTPEEIDQVAQGRVWSGQDAFELGLVDKLGDRDQAIASAAVLAGLEGDDWDVRVIEKELDFEEQMMAEMLATASVWVGAERIQASSHPLASVMDSVATALEPLTELNDPRGAYASCLCEVQ